MSDQEENDIENGLGIRENAFKKLLRGAKSGDQAATAELVDQYRDYLLFLANQKMEPNLNAKLGASDIVQQSMLAIYQNLPNFRGASESEFKAWIRTILKNHFLNSKRQYANTRQRQINNELHLGDSQLSAPELVDTEVTPQGQALLKEMAQELDQCLSQLSESYQNVLKLRNWKEKSFNEIGEELNCSADAARKLWFRAFQRLQDTVLKTRPEFASHLSSVYDQSKHDDPEDHE